MDKSSKKIQLKLNLFCLNNTLEIINKIDKKRKGVKMKESKLLVNKLILSEPIKPIIAIDKKFTMLIIRNK